jgi:glycogen operon protein
VTARGEPVHDDSLVLLFNAHHEPVQFVLPPRRFGSQWQLELSSAAPDAPPTTSNARGMVTIEARAILVLSRRR